MALMLCIVNGAAMANMGIPMIAVVWPFSWLAFVPIVLVEWWLACRMLKIPARRGLVVATVGNLFSTLLAIPVLWALMLLIGGMASFKSPDSFLGVVNSVVVHSAWLAPWEDGDHWRVPAAAITLCVPFYFGSVASEYLVAKGFLGRAGLCARCGRWAWVANGVTYGAIVCWLAVMVILQLN